MFNEQQLRTEDPLLKTTVAGRYKIHAVVGVGGWSKVYEATDETLNRTVALKVLHRHFIVDPNRLERFKREAESASILAHPNIATVYDFGQLPDGTPFIVLEFIDGDSIADTIKLGKRFDSKQCMNVFAQVADALNVAHTVGIIHRDIKPSNIMLNSHGVPKVVDFGTAKFTLDDGKSLTQTNELVGTPSYMSPEQCRGESSDERSDVYSLGCVMYESLTGVKAFPSENVANCIYRQITEMPPRIGTVLPPDKKIPITLERIIFKAMSKQKSDRFPSMSAVAAALQHCNQSPNPLSSILSELIIRYGSSKPGKHWRFAIILSVALMFAAAFAYSRINSMQFQSIVVEADSAHSQMRFSDAKALYSAALVFAGAHPGSADAASKLKVLDQLTRIGYQGKDQASVFGYLSQAISICGELHDKTREQRYEKERNMVAEVLERDKALPMFNDMETPTDRGIQLAHFVMNNPRVIDAYSLVGLTDADLSPLAHATNAKAVIMSDAPGITDKGLEFVSHLKDLKQLDLINCNVSKLRPLLALRNTLERLNLKQTPLDSDGMSVIGQLTKLYDLDLSRTSTYDSDLKKLYNLHSLRFLRVGDCHFTEGALKQLHLALPQLRIGERPPTYKSLFLQLNRAIAEHHYPEVLAVCSEALRIPTLSFSNRADIMERKASCERQLHQFEAADKTYVECVDLLQAEGSDENRMKGEWDARQEAIFEHADEALKQGKPKESERLAKLALKVGQSPRSLSSYLCEGDWQMKTNHPQLALASFAQGQRLLENKSTNPYTPILAERQAEAREQLKQYDRAAELRLLVEERIEPVAAAGQPDGELVHNKRIANLRSLVTDYLENPNSNSTTKAYETLQKLFSVLARWKERSDAGDVRLIDAVGVKLAKEGNHETALNCFRNEQRLLQQNPKLASARDLTAKLEQKIEQERRSCGVSAHSR